MASATIHGFVVTQAEGLTDEQRENNRRWVEALRSGAYDQTRGRLYNDGAYCCLGVAERILGATIEANRLVRNESPQTATLSLFAMDDLGLSDDCGIVVAAGISRFNLAELNDEQNFTFRQLADIIAYSAGLEEAPRAV